MSVVFVLVPLAVLIVIAALVGFRWAAKRGQYDDLDTPPVRMLHDDSPDRDR